MQQLDFYQFSPFQGRCSTAHILQTFKPWINLQKSCT